MSFDLQERAAKPSVGHWHRSLATIRNTNSVVTERGFGLLARAAKPSETRVVHKGGNPSKY